MSATNLASEISKPAQHVLLLLTFNLCSYKCIESPTTLYPHSTKIAAVTEESTPPDIATAIVLVDGLPSKPISSIILYLSNTLSIFRDSNYQTV